MPSLGEVYGGDVAGVADRRQRVVGITSFVAGVTMLVAAIGVATTQVGYATLGERLAREVGGVVGGLGLPAVLLGIFVVLPASLRVRIAAGVGTLTSLAGLGLFVYAYPTRWVRADPLLAFVTSAVYVTGLVVTIWAVFGALATLETRRRPGGTARMAITESGTIELVRDAAPSGPMGGVGLLGEDPDGAVETQTNRPEDAPGGPGVGRERADGGATRVHATAPGEDPLADDAAPGADHSPADAASSERTATDEHTDGSGVERTSRAVRDNHNATTSTRPNDSAGTDDGDVDTVSTIPTRDAPDVSADSTPSESPPDDRLAADAYCGNCRHFEYVDDEDGDPVPYCGFHEYRMQDMDACSAWTEHHL